MAAGASRPVLAVAATVIVVVSLWPLRLLSERLELAGPRRAHVRVQLAEASRLAELFDWLAERHVDIVHFDSEREDNGRHALDLVLGLPARMDRARLIAELDTLDWVSLDHVGRRPE